MPQRKLDLGASVPPVAGRLGQIAQMDQLPAGSRIEARADGSVWLIEQPEGAKDPTEQRVDSRMDKDVVSKGGTLWYSRFLKKPVTKDKETK